MMRTLRLVRVPSATGFKPGPRRLWFRGEDAYFDVFLDLRDGEVEWFQFTLRGICLTWDPRSGKLQTDVTGEMNVSGAPVSASALLYGVRDTFMRRFTMLTLLMLESAPDEPLFADVAHQLRAKMDNRLSA